MQLNKPTILTTSLTCVALLGSLVIGIAIGRSPQLLDASEQDRKQETREAILSKLEKTARQQAQAQPSFVDPFSQSTRGRDPFEQLHQQMDQLFGRIGVAPSLFSFGGMGFGTNLANALPAQIEVEEAKDEYRVVISLAKGSELELATELDDNTLSISALVRTEISEGSGGSQMNSTSMSQFSRAISFDSPVDAMGMQTEKSASVVVIRIPKLS